jgi:uncharacterized protein involved in exopolysaccharide biosynthesis
MSHYSPELQDHPPPSLDEEDEISIIDLLTVIGKYKYTLFIVPFLCACVAAFISLVLQPTFTAKATFVNSSKPAGGASSQLLDQLGGGLGGSLAGVLGPNSGDTLVALLQSNAVRAELIEKFDLQNYYQKKNLEDTRKKIQEQLIISSDKKSSLITVEVKDKDPQFAAELANAHLEALRHLQKRLSKEEAQQRRDYFEQQIDVISQKPFRDPLIQTALMNSLIRQYETARMDESRESLVIQAVDAAIAPVERTSPKRVLMVLATCFASLFLTLIWVLILNAMRNASTSPETATRLANLKTAWRIRNY